MMHALPPAVREIDTDLVDDDRPRKVRPMPGGRPLRILGLLLSVTAVIVLLWIGALLVLEEADERDRAAHERRAPAVVDEDLPVRDEANDESSFVPLPPIPDHLIESTPDLMARRAREIARESLAPGPTQATASAAADRERRLFALQRQLATLSEDAARLGQIMGAWNTLGFQLRDEEIGHRLASSGELVEQFMALIGRDRPGHPAIAQLQADIQQLIDTAPDNSADHANLIRVEARLPLLQSELQAALRRYTEDQELMESLVMRARELPVSSESLFEAVERVLEAERAEQLRQMAEARQQAVDENTRRLAAAEAQRIAEEGRLAQLQVEREAAALREQQAEAERAAERERMRQEVLKPEVLALLRPLTEPDTAQITNVTAGGLPQWGSVREPAPMSLQMLEIAGVLEPTIDGLKKLVAMNSHHGTSRPRWNMGYLRTEPHLWSREQHQRVVAMQDYLIHYGEILVEEGLLAP